MGKDLATPEQIRDYCLEWLRENKEVLNIHGLSAKISGTNKPIPNFLQMVYGHRRLKSKYIMPLYAYLMTYHGVQPINWEIEEVQNIEMVEDQKPEPEPDSKVQEYWGKDLIFRANGQQVNQIVGRGFEFSQSGKNIDLSLNMNPVVFNMDLLQSAEKAAKAVRELLIKIEK